MAASVCTSASARWAISTSMPNCRASTTC
jgi:hypothetical protein